MEQSEAPGIPFKTRRTIVNVLAGVRLNLYQKIALYVVFAVLIILWGIFVVPSLAQTGPWAYVTAFAINLVSNASVMVPIPGNAVVMTMAGTLDPLWLGIISGIGGALGEMTGYWVGAQGHDHMRDKKLYKFLERNMQRFGGIILFFVGLLPFIPSDIGAILGGVTRYPFWKYSLFMGTGKILMNIGLMYVAAQAFHWAEPYLEWMT